MATNLKEPITVETDRFLDEPEVQKRPMYKKPGFLIVAAVAVIVALVFGIRYFIYSSAHESTDDAFLDGQVIQISSRVAGHVARVYIKDNQQVKKGDLLLELDPNDFQTKLNKAQATLQEAESKTRAAGTNVSLTQANSRAAVEQAASGVDAARAGVSSMEAQVTTARSRADQAAAAVKSAQDNVHQAAAQVSAAEAEVTKTNADLKRYQQLHSQDEVSKQQLDVATAAAQTAQANLEAARTHRAAVQSQVEEARAAEQAQISNWKQAQAQALAARAQVGEATGKLSAANTAPQQVAMSQTEVSTNAANAAQQKAEVEQAQLDLSYTKVYAPEDGRVTRKSVEEGQYLQVGQTLMALVTGDIWVTANFKENQLDHLHAGQATEITVDAYPGKTFAAHVDSIQYGTGARFSMLPPENATGNYVKVVQRVPVKIVFDQQPDPQYALGPGMSVVPEVSVK